MNALSAALRIGAAVLALILACAASAHATSTIVPDNFATIQAAVNGTLVDTIYVHEGEYPEDVILHRNLVLVPYPQNGPTPARYEYPRVRSLHVTSNTGGGHIDVVRVTGFHFRGPVSFVNDALSGIPEVTFEGCRMDAGFSAGSGPNLFASVRLRGNVVLGSLVVSSLYYPSIVENAIIGGGVTASGNGSVVVEGNFIEGPGSLGLSICCSDGLPLAFDNVVRGFITGIRASERGQVVRNRVTNCSGNGIELTGSSPSTASAIDNIVKSCGGYGIRAFGAAAPFVFENTVDSTGQAGIRCEGVAVPAIVRNNTVRFAGSNGIWVDAGLAASSNVVLHASGDGIRTVTDAADSNVVGRCGGDGVHASSTSVRQNTSYLNQGAGLFLSGGTSAAVNHDIAFGNTGVGLDATAAASPVLGCNDWYSNVAGATAGIAPAGTDLAVDPQFCDVAVDVVTLAATSPVLTAPGCGLIGARGLGCSSPTAVEPSPGGPHAFVASPIPARGAVRFSWAANDKRSTIEVFDLQGARRFHVDLPAGDSEFRWNAVDDSGLLVPSGIYFVRRTSSGGVEATRIVLQR